MRIKAQTVLPTVCTTKTLENHQELNEIYYTEPIGQTVLQNRVIKYRMWGKMLLPMNPKKETGEKNSKYKEW